MLESPEIIAFICNWACLCLFSTLLSFYQASSKKSSIVTSDKGANPFIKDGVHSCLW